MNELLSPAGTIESFYAAISGGCDAIYLGLDKFSARAYASNFNLENLKELVDYAHLRKVKIYITMNTIVYDNELAEIYKTIDELARIHVDALIIQDLSIFNYVTNKYKSLEAHVSTQMGIDDFYGAKLVKELGATRVVFAREAPLKVMKDIKNRINIEQEAFIHGALCVAYSGNCLMSSMIGERSGNRGRCAGCCRQVYSLIDLSNNKTIKTGYLLSMKDLNTSNNIKEMGFIDSFKIEGRMKEPSYVANVTNYYRDLIDNKAPINDGLLKVFNRTYTNGFINGANSSDITNIERPNNYGYPIGEIAKINKNKIWIKLFKPLSKGDQIRIESKNPFEEISIAITKMFDADFKETATNSKVVIIYTDKKIDLKAKVYKTKDSLFLKDTNFLLNRKEYKKFNVDMEITLKINEPILLKIIFEKTETYVKSDYIVEKSIKSATTKENIYNQLSKLNDTPYKLNNLKINMDENIFVSLKSLNELRRELIDALNLRRLNKKVLLNQQKEISPSKFELHSPKICVQVSNLEQYEIAKELGIEHIYYKNVVRRNNEKYVDDSEEILVGGLGSLEYYKGKNISLVTDYSLNVTNYKSAAILSSLGANRITLSQEISKDNINKLIKNYYKEYNTYPNLELIVYGRTIVMHSKYCPLKRLNMCGKCKNSNYALKDKFMSFPILFNEDCTTMILNSKTLNIMNDLNNLNGINFYRLVFTTESKEEMKEIITKFKNKLLNNSDSIFFNPSKETRGHFIKNPL